MCRPTDAVARHTIVAGGTFALRLRSSLRDFLDPTATGVGAPPTRKPLVECRSIDGRGRSLFATSPLIIGCHPLTTNDGLCEPIAHPVLIESMRTSRCAFCFRTIHNNSHVSDFSFHCHCSARCRSLDQNWINASSAEIAIPAIPDGALVLVDHPKVPIVSLCLRRLQSTVLERRPAVDEREGCVFVNHGSMPCIPRCDERCSSGRCGARVTASEPDPRLPILEQAQHEWFFREQLGAASDRTRRVLRSEHGESLVPSECSPHVLVARIQAPNASVNSMPGAEIGR